MTNRSVLEAYPGLAVHLLLNDLFVATLQMRCDVLHCFSVISLWPPNRCRDVMYCIVSQQPVCGHLIDEEM